MTPNQVSSIPATGALHRQRLQERDTSLMGYQQLDKPILLSPPRHRHHPLQPGCLLSGSVKALCVAPNTPTCFSTYHHHLHKSHALVKAPLFDPYYVSSSPACREDPHCPGCDCRGAAASVHIMQQGLNLTLPVQEYERCLPCKCSGYSLRQLRHQSSSSQHQILTAAQHSSCSTPACSEENCMPKGDGDAISRSNPKGDESTSSWSRRFCQTVMWRWAAPSVSRCSLVTCLNSVARQTLRLTTYRKH